MPIEIPDLSFRAIAAACEKCLNDHHPSKSIPVPIEDIVDIGYRIDLVEEPELEARFSTLAFITHDLKEIRVDKTVYSKQPYRLRFSLAHELGHLILHESIYRNFAFESSQQWRQCMTDLRKADYDKLEWQADTFGRLLLVPSEKIQEEFARIRSALSSAKTTFKLLNPSSQDYAVKAMAKSFGVSTGTIWYRMRDEALI